MNASLVRQRDDWLGANARHRQVLWQAGAVYQFRHAVLQSHLASMDE